ncbi:MAG: hypothetical protein ACI4QZ_05905 [Eubacteriales bacterium]
MDIVNLAQSIIEEFCEGAVEKIDDRIINNIVKTDSKIICQVIRKGFKKLDSNIIALHSEKIGKELSEYVKNSGFEILPDPLLQIICVKYVELVVKDALLDTEFEFLTQSVLDILIEQYETQKRVEEDVNSVLAPKGMCML